MSSYNQLPFPIPAFSLDEFDRIAEREATFLRAKPRSVFNPIRISQHRPDPPTVERIVLGNRRYVRIGGRLLTA